MLRDDAVADIQERLGFRTDLQESIIRRMQMTQRLLEQGRTLPWFLIEEDQTLAVTAEDPSVELPAGFIREVDYKKGSLYYVPTSGVNPAPTFLRKMALDEARTQYRDLTGDRPAVYSLRSTSIYLFPIPTTGFDLKLDYYKRDDELTTNIENKWLANAPDVLIGHAGASMADTIKNSSAKIEFEQLGKVALQSMLNENILRETANRVYILGRVE